jgi:hypothetical protein
LTLRASSSILYPVLSFPLPSTPLRPLLVSFHPPDISFNSCLAALLFFALFFTVHSSFFYFALSFHFLQSLNFILLSSSHTISSYFPRPNRSPSSPPMQPHISHLPHSLPPPFFHLQPMRTSKLKVSWKMCSTKC